MSPACWHLRHALCAGCACICHLDAATGARITITPLDSSPAAVAPPVPAAGEDPTTTHTTTLEGLF